MALSGASSNERSIEESSGIDGFTNYLNHTTESRSEGIQSAENEKVQFLSGEE